MADKRESIRFLIAEVFGVPRFNDGAILADKDYHGAPLFTYDFPSSATAPGESSSADRKDT